MSIRGLFRRKISFKEKAEIVRRERGYTQKDIANWAGVSTRTVIRTENGETLNKEVYLLYTLLYTELMLDVYGYEEDWEEWRWMK